MSELKLVEGKQYVYRNGVRCKLVHWEEKKQRWTSVSFYEDGSPKGLNTHRKDGTSDLSEGLNIVSEYIEPPKPMEVWVNLYEYLSGTRLFGSVYESREIAEDCATVCLGRRIIHFREVIE